MTLRTALATSPLTTAQVVGFDISRRALRVAEEATYPVSRSGEIPEPHLKAYMRRGVGPREGDTCPE